MFQAALWILAYVINPYYVKLFMQVENTYNGRTYLDCMPRHPGINAHKYKQQQSEKSTLRWENSKQFSKQQNLPGK